MHKSNQEQVKSIRRMLVFFIIFFLGLSFPLQIWSERLPIDCYDTNRDEDFMSTMVSFDFGDSYIPAQCSNYTSDNNQFQICYYINATQRQRDYSSTCRWLGPSYFADGGYFTFRYLMPVIISIAFILTFFIPKTMIRFLGADEVIY